MTNTKQTPTRNGKPDGTSASVSDATPASAATKSKLGTEVIPIELGPPVSAQPEAPAPDVDPDPYAGVLRGIRARVAMLAALDRKALEPQVARVKRARTALEQARSRASAIEQAIDDKQKARAVARKELFALEQADEQARRATLLADLPSEGNGKASKKPKASPPSDAAARALAADLGRADAAVKALDADLRVLRPELERTEDAVERAGERVEAAEQALHEAVAAQLEVAIARELERLNDSPLRPLVAAFASLRNEPEAARAVSVDSRTAPCARVSRGRSGVLFEVLLPMLEGFGDHDELERDIEALLVAGADIDQVRGAAEQRELERRRRDRIAVRAEQREKQRAEREAARRRRRWLFELENEETALVAIERLRWQPTREDVEAWLALEQRRSEQGDEERTKLIGVLTRMRSHLVAEDVSARQIGALQMRKVRRWRDHQPSDEDYDDTPPPAA